VAALVAAYGHLPLAPIVIMSSCDRIWLNVQGCSWSHMQQHLRRLLLLPVILLQDWLP
jgi:hypothetical protein